MARTPRRYPFPAKAAGAAYAEQLRENPRGRRATASPRALRALAVANPFAYESQLVDTDEGWDFKQNPVGRTITAKREGTCPITGDAIHPGDSITKTADGWALSEHVHENPRTFGGGMSRAQKATRSAKKISRREDTFEGIGLAQVMSRARPGSRSAREAKAELAGANRRKRRAFEKAQSNPSQVMHAAHMLNNYGIDMSRALRIAHMKYNPSDAVENPKHKKKSR